MHACARRSTRSRARRSRALRRRRRPPTARRSEGDAMTTNTISRRGFLQSGAAAGGLLALEFTHAGAALAQLGAPSSSPEVTHWILIQPDDRVIIRVARSEMGQGSLTGLAQLVAEELECDW